MTATHVPMPMRPTESDAIGDRSTTAVLVGEVTVSSDDVWLDVSIRSGGFANPVSQGFSHRHYSWQHYRAVSQ